MLKIQNKNELLPFIIDTIESAVYVVDSNFKLRGSNKWGQNLYEELEAKGYITHDINENFFSNSEEIIQIISESLKSKKGVKKKKVKISFNNESNKSMYFYLTTNIFTKDKEDYLIIIIDDITALERSREKLGELSIKDPLTSLYNRRYLFRTLKQEINRVKRFNRDFTLLMIDIDDFKRVNDNYGHIKGDEVLKEISNVLLENLRNIDVLGRYGGEEFMVILPETNLNEAYFVGERMRRAVEKTTIEDLNITVSIGIGEYINGEEYKNTIDRADKGLYEAKKTGKNKVVINS